MLKRIYLISGILISFIFPIISFHYQVKIPALAISQADMSGANTVNTFVISFVSFVVKSS